MRRSTILPAVFAAFSAGLWDAIRKNPVDRLVIDMLEWILDRRWAGGYLRQCPEASTEYPR